MSPRGGPCNHRSCADYGEGCRQLTDEELAPGPEDFELADQLVADGYMQTSRRLRHVTGPLTAVPLAETMMRPEALETKWGRAMARLWNDQRSWQLRLAEHPEIQTLTLTVKQFAAFRTRGGGRW